MRMLVLFDETHKIIMQDIESGRFLRQLGGGRTRV